MRLFAPIVASFLLFAPVAKASMHVVQDLRQLITTSDDIIIGTVQSVGAVEKGGRVVGEGNLLVQRVIWSRARPGETLTLRWYTESKTPSAPVEVAESDKKTVLWFLTRDPDGAVRANEQRMTPDDAGTVLDTLAAYPYWVIAPDRNPGESAVVTIEFRNATDKAITVPAVRNLDGVVTYGDGVTIKSVLLTGQNGGDVLAPRADAPLRHDSTLAPVVLVPGASSRVELPVSTWYDTFPPGHFQMAICINGRTTNHAFNMLTPFASRLTRVLDTPAEGPFYVQVIRSGAPEAKWVAVELHRKPTVATAVAEELMGLCDSLSTDTRRLAMWLLSGTQLPPEKRIDFLMDRSDDPLVGNAALLAASNALSGDVQYRRDEIIQHLIERLSDEDSAVRNAAATQLSDLRAKAALPDLHRVAIYDGSEQVRSSAQWAVDTIEGRKCCQCSPKKAGVFP